MDASPFYRDWRTRRVSSSSSSVKCVEEGDEPIVRRKTVITIGSPPTNHSYDNETLTTSSSSTEVGETACGRITIQVKTIDNQHPHDDEDWLSQRTIPLKPSSIKDPSWISGTIRRNNNKVCSSLILIEGSPEEKRKSYDWDAIENLPAESILHPGAEVNKPGSHQQQSEETAAPTIRKNNSNKEIAEASNNNRKAEVRHVDYLEWLKSLDWPEGKHRVQFDRLDEASEEDDEVGGRPSVIGIHREPKIVVVETVKQPVPPKSILKNSGSRSSSSSRAEEEKLAWKLEYHQKKALVGSKLMSLASGTEDMSFTGTLTRSTDEPPPGAARPLVPAESHRPITRNQHPLLTALIAEPYHPTIGSEGNPSNDAENLRGLHPSSNRADEVSSPSPRGATQVEVVGWDKINTVKAIRAEDEEEEEEVNINQHQDSSMILTSGMAVDKAKELVRQFFDTNNNRPGSQPVMMTSTPRDARARKLSLSESNLIAELAHFSSSESASGDSDCGSSSILDSSSASSMDQQPLSSSSSSSDQERTVTRGRSPVRRSRIPMLIPRPLRSSSFVLSTPPPERITPTVTSYVPSHRVKPSNTTTNVSKRTRSEGSRTSSSSNSRRPPSSGGSVAPKVSTKNKKSKQSSDNA